MVNKLSSPTQEKPPHEAAEPFRLPWSAGKSLPAELFADIRCRMLLEHCKWDAQVGDIGTLADFPLILRAETWLTVASAAEALAAEVMAAESELLQNPLLLDHLGLPQKILTCLEAVAFSGRTTAAVRTMRFDFHLTTEGWRISEVNSDVPGGFTEASNFTRLMAAHYPQYDMAGDPLEEWSTILSRSDGDGDNIGLLTAPGFMEDHQIMACLAQRLAEKGCKSLLANPRQLIWRDGRACLNGAKNKEPFAVLVRFYQAEWLAELPEHCGWDNFFTGGKTPVANPGEGILAESKRFPLVWERMGTPLPMWRALLPPARDPRDAAWERDDSWLLKSAFCNTGDTVSIRSLMNSNQWNATVKMVRKNPESWIAQKRFEPVALATSLGPMFPCIGVYTLDGKAAGAYARIAKQPIIDFEAMDIALLLENREAARG